MINDAEDGIKKTRGNFGIHDQSKFIHALICKRCGTICKGAARTKWRFKQRHMKKCYNILK